MTHQEAQTQNLSGFLGSRQFFQYMNISSTRCQIDFFAIVQVHRNKHSQIAMDFNQSCFLKNFPLISKLCHAYPVQRSAFSPRGHLGTYLQETLQTLMALHPIIAPQQLDAFKQNSVIVCVFLPSWYQLSKNGCLQPNIDFHRVYVNPDGD